MKKITEPENETEEKISQIKSEIDRKIGLKEISFGDAVRLYARDYIQNLIRNKYGR